MPFMSNQNQENFISIKEAAKLLKVTDKTLRRWEKKGILNPARTHGGHRRYLLSQVEAFKKDKGRGRLTQRVIKEKIQQFDTKLTPPVSVYRQNIIAADESGIQTPQSTYLKNIIRDFDTPTATDHSPYRLYIIGFISLVVITLSLGILGIKLSPYDKFPNLLSQVAVKIPFILSQQSDELSVSNMPQKVLPKDFIGAVLAATSYANLGFKVNVPAIFVETLAANGGEITTSATTFDLLNTTATTLNVGGEATALSLGATTGTTTVNNSLTVAGANNDIAGTLNLSGNNLTSAGDLTLDPTGGGVKIGTGTPGSVDLTGDDLYVTGDLEVDGTSYIPTLSINGDNFTDLTGSGLQISSGTLTATLGTSIDSSEISNDEIKEEDLKISNSPSNTQLLTYNSSTGGFTWIDQSGATGGWTDGGTTIYPTTTTDSVTIGGTTELAKLGIDGDTNEIQLLVQGNSTQTTNLAVFENSSGTDLFTFTNSGGLTLVDGGLIDLSAIVHDDATTQGLKLPQNTTFTNLSSGEGFIAWDTDDNTLKVFDGTTWGTISGGGSFTSFTLSGDGGVDQTITDSNVLEVTGGTGITTTGTATDIISLAFTSTELNDLTWGTGAAATIAWSTSLTGATDPILTFGDNVLTIGSAATITATDVTAFNCTDCLNWDDFADAMTLDAATDINLGAVALTIDLDSTGDFSIRDVTTDIATFADTGAITFTPTAGQSLTINNSAQGAADLAAISPTWTADNSADALAITTTYNVSASTSTIYGLNLTNADNTTNTGVIDALALFSNDQATETLADGIIIRHNASSGTLTDGLQIENTTAGGTISNAINILETAGTITTGLNIGAGVGTALSLQNAETIDNTTANTILFASDQTTGIDAGVVRLPVKTDTGDPTNNNAEGNIYYNTFDNKFRCYQNAAWTDCVAAGATTTLQQAYNNDGDGSDVIITLDTTDGNLIVKPIAGTNFQVAQVTSAPTTDMVTITNTGLGTITDGVDGVNLTFVTGNPAGASTNTGLNLDLTSGGDAANEVLNGIDLTLTGTSGTERGINIGDNNFDTDINATTDLTLGIGGTNEITLTATNFSPSTSVGNSLGSSALEWAQLFLGDNTGVNFGLDDDWTVAYDETTDNRLEFTAAGATGFLVSTTTGTQTYSSAVATTSTTSSAWVFTDNSLTTGTGGYVNSSSITEGNLFQIATTAGADTLTSGNLLRVSSDLANTTFTGNLAYIDWSPDGTTEIFNSSADLLHINAGQYANVGYLLNITDNGSAAFTVSQAAITSALPHSFTAAGDVSIAYDLLFTNQTASYLKSKAPLYLQAGEAFESNNLAVQTYGTGTFLIDKGSYTANMAATDSLATINFATPVDTTGTQSHQGLFIDPTIGNATGGTNTANFIATDAVTGDAQVTLNAINIGALTGTAATETAINISTGWDNLLVYNGTTIIDGTGNVAAAQISGDLFTAAGDTGSATIARGDTLTVAGGTNLTSAHSGDTITVNLDDSITLAGDLTVQGQNVNFDNATDIDVDTATAAVLTISAGASNFLSLDSRTTTSGVVATTLTGIAPAFAAAAGGEYTTLTVTGPTITMDTSGTQVTSLMETVTLTGSTITNSFGAQTIDKATTLSLTAPVDSTNATLTDDSALRILNVTSGAGVLTNQYGLYIEDLTSGATADYGIYIAGADTYALYAAADDIATLDNLWVGATAETITNTSFIPNGDDAFISGTLGVESDIYTDGNVDIAGGAVTTANTTATLFNTNATTLSMGGAATTLLDIGNGTGNYTAINIGSGIGTHVINIAGTGATAADTVNIGTGGTGADTINLGSSASTTAINLTSGTGAQTFASSVAAGTTTTSAWVFTDNLLTTGTGGYVNSSSITQGNLFQIATTTGADTLTSGNLLRISSDLANTTFTGNLASIDWSPDGTTEIFNLSADLLEINAGQYANVGYLLNITDNGSAAFNVSQSAITSALPHSFTAAGDVSVAYDLLFTNQTASYIKSNAPLTIEAGEAFESNNLTLKTYNSGKVVIDTPLNSGITYTTAPWLQLTSSNNFGGTGLAGAWIDWNSTIQEEFNKQRTSLSADTTGAAGAAFGDGGGWGVYESAATGCTFSSLADTAGGITRISADAANTGCLTMMDEAANDARSILDADNLPTMIFKVRPSQADATSGVYVGMADSTTGVTAAPANFIGFSNNNAGTLGASWFGITRSASISTTVTCTGATISTTQFGVLAVQVRSATDVRFFFDTDASNGISFTECSSGSATNIPTAALAPQIHWQELTGGAASTLDVDYYRAWQDDPTNPQIAQQNLNKTVDFSSNSTVAQTLPSNDLNMEEGTLVSFDTSSDKGKVVPSKGKYDTNLAGVVVKQGGVNLDSGTFDGVRVAISGVTLIKVSTENGPISVGDSLTSSSAPGVAMKLTSGGSVIGKALESYQSSNSGAVGTVIVFVNVSWYDPTIYITGTGNIASTLNPPVPTYEQFFAPESTGFQALLSNLYGKFAENIKSGVLEVAALVSPSLKTNVISPLGTDLAIQLNDSVDGKDSQLLIQNQDSETVASIDSAGNATFSGELRVGKLFADEIISASNSAQLTIEQIEELLANAQADQELLQTAKNWQVETATSSGTLNELALTNLYVTANAAIEFLSVNNSLVVGQDLVLSSTTGSDGALKNSLNSLYSPLELQSGAAQPLHLMAGLVTIDTDGNVVVGGDLTVVGKISSSGINLHPNNPNNPNLLGIFDDQGEKVGGISATGAAQLKSLTTGTLIIPADPAATTSATLAGLTFETAASAGKARILTGWSEITINQPQVNSSSLIFVTPTSHITQPLYIKEQTNGSFVVGFDEAVSESVEFNWWIVELAQQATAE